MNKLEYMELHANLCKRMQEITKAKNADYTGKTDDPFANFRRCEQLDICTTEIGFLTRMTDKIARINSLLQNGVAQVKDESIEDTLLDLANYSLLLIGYLKSKKTVAATTTAETPVLGPRGDITYWGGVNGGYK